MKSDKQKLEKTINELESIKDLLITILKDDRIKFSVRDEYWEKLLAVYTEKYQD